MQRACAVLSYVACPDVQYFFSPYLINNTIFEKKKLLNTKCVFRFSVQLLFEIFLILRSSERDMIKYVYWSSCTVPIILARF